MISSPPIVESIDLLKGTGDALPLLSNHGDDFVVPSPGARLNGRGGIDVLGLRIDHGEDALRSWRFHASTRRRTISTFSSDIAHAVSLEGVLLSMQSGGLESHL